jgi:hypothetical protein
MSYLQARGDLGDRIEAQKARECERHPVCGLRKGAFRDLHSARGRGFIARFRCKRLDCEFCQRRLIVDNLEWLDSAVLHTSSQSPTPRSGLLHVALVPWRRWRTVARSLYRYASGAAYVRIRHDVNLTLIVCERPFPGSTAMIAGAAVGMAASAIEKCDRVWRAVYWVGAWKRPKKTTTKRYVRVETRLDPETALQLAEEFSAKCRRLSGPLTGAAWIFAPDADPQRVEEFYRRLSCRTWDLLEDKGLNTSQVRQAPSIGPVHSDPLEPIDTGPPSWPRPADNVSTILRPGSRW